jgi:hypothetical protein
MDCAAIGDALGLWIAPPSAAQSKAALRPPHSKTYRTKRTRHRANGRSWLPPLRRLVRAWDRWDSRHFESMNLFVLARASKP